MEFSHLCNANFSENSGMWNGVVVYANPFSFVIPESGNLSVIATGSYDYFCKSSLGS